MIKFPFVGMLLTLGLHKNSLVRSYSEHRILTPKIPKQSGKTVVTILVTTVSIFSMVLSASRHLPCGGCPEGVLFFAFIGRVLIRFSDQTLQKELRGSLAPDEAEDAGGLDARQGRQRRLAQS